MATGSGDELDAAGRGHLRASHADREQVIGILKAAFVQGRLAKDEFDLRVGQTLASRTYAELAALTADLPAGLIGARPPRKPAPARTQPPVNKPLMWGAWAIVVLVIGAVVAAFAVGVPELAGFAVLPFLIAVPVAGTLTLDTWREKRSRGQLPPPPAPSPGGPASPRPLPPDRQLPQGYRDYWHTAEAVRRRLSRPARAGSHAPRRGCPRGPDGFGQRVTAASGAVTVPAVCPIGR